MSTNTNNNNNNTKTDKTATKKRRWFSRRNLIITVIVLAVLGYFCLIPSRFVASPEHTQITQSLITHSLNKDGTPDYSKVYTIWNNERLRNPEDNGMRMLIAALGPTILEQTQMMRIVPWEELPTNKVSKSWYENYWLPLCSAMQIDPNKKPRFNYCNIHYFFEQLWGQERGEEVRKFCNQLMQSPWKTEEQPDAARWLEEMSPVLDLLGVAARKPNWACYRQKSQPDALFSDLLLPDIQATREHGRNLRVRISERIGRGDLDGAWYDIITIFRFGRHLQNETFIIAHLVGSTLERQGCEAVLELLKYGKPNAEQLKLFAEELDSLPKQIPLDQGMISFIEKQMRFDFLFHCNFTHPDMNFQQDIIDQSIGQYKNGSLQVIKQLVLPTTIKTALALPFDRNIAAKRLAEQINSYENVIRELNPKKRRDLLSSLERVTRDNHWGSKLFLIPLIRYRSQWIGDLIYQYMHPAWEAYYIAMDKTQALYDLHRIAIALERYQREHQTYPETLDVLVPKFLDEIPLDIFTSRDTITYRRTETSFLLYSYGQNEKDDNGTPKDDKNGNSDIVVQF